MGKVGLERELSSKGSLLKRHETLGLISWTTVGKDSIVNVHYFSVINAVSHMVLMFIILIFVSQLSSDV